MASSMAVSNSVTNSDVSRNSKKKNQILNQSRDQQNLIQNKNRWKTESEQQIYSTKLLEALRQVRSSPPPYCSSSSTNEAPKRGRAVREAADRALAMAAKGRTRWSRAILMNRLKLKCRKQKRQRVNAITKSNNSTKQKLSIVKSNGKNYPAVQRKMRFLGRLVPGCRKQPLPVVLEETTDYISALQMQIRAMTALSELISRLGSGTGYHLG